MGITIIIILGIVGAIVTGWIVIGSLKGIRKCNEELRDIEYRRLVAYKNFFNRPISNGLRDRKNNC